MGHVSVKQLPLFLKLMIYFPYFAALVMSYCRQTFINLMGSFQGSSEDREIKEYGPLVKSMHAMKLTIQPSSKAHVPHCGLLV